MTHYREEDRYRWMTEEQKERVKRIETLSTLSLDELKEGDIIAIGARNGKYRAREMGSFTLTVIATEQVDEGDEPRTRVSFQFGATFPFSFNDDQGKPLDVENGSILESDFSSISSDAYMDRSPYKPDHIRMKTGETYWFRRKVDGEFSAVIAQDVTNISLLREG